MSSPCPPSTAFALTTFDAAWYRIMAGQTAANSNRPYALKADCASSVEPAQAHLRVCDQFGNCADSAATTAAAAETPDLAAGNTITSPSVGAAITSTAPLLMTGRAFSSAFLKSLTVKVDGTAVVERTWSPATTTSEKWQATWTPAGEGSHRVQSVAVDWQNRTTSAESEFLVDTQPPTLSIATDRITAAQVLNGHLPLSGAVADASGIVSLEVGTAGSAWSRATVTGGAWSGFAYPGRQFTADGEKVAVSARARDRAGWTTVVTTPVLVDMTPPTPPGIALAYQQDGASHPITQTGTTVPAAAPKLEMSWTASADGAGLDDYEIAWTIADASGQKEVHRTRPPAGSLADVYQAAEGEKITAGVTSRDNSGNRTSLSFGPVYVDTPLTPDYIRLDDTTYRGWMDSGCSLVGADRRAARVLPGAATRDAEQRLYVTWDSRALRLAWTGANWASDGDLYVYLGATGSGTGLAHSPTPSTGLRLPGVWPAGPAPDAMLADYAVWVQDATTAMLLKWNGSAWAEAATLSAGEYRFTPGVNGGQTDLYLPFAILGIREPAKTPLELLAFADEAAGGGLRPWAVLPATNPAISRFAVSHAVVDTRAAPYGMLNRYRFASLASGVCPNGSRNVAAGQPQYPDTDVALSIEAEPSGATYRYLQDNLSGWWATVFGPKPPEFSSLVAGLDNNHAPLHDGQEVVYTIRYANHGTNPSMGVKVRVRSGLALALPGGVAQTSGERGYLQEIELPDLAPGQSGSVAVHGRVDRAAAEAAYRACQSERGGQPHACDASRRWALLGAQVTRATGGHEELLEWMWVDHRVDLEAPVFAGVLPASSLIARTDGLTLSGFAYDATGVKSLTVELRGPGGATATAGCDVRRPSSGRWTCRLGGATAGAADGDTVQVRVLATDTAGQTGAWSGWRNFVVDREAPRVSTSAQFSRTLTSAPLAVRSLDLAGAIADNHAVGGVEVCSAGSCRAAALLTPIDSLSWTGADRPASRWPLTRRRPAGLAPSSAPLRSRTPSQWVQSGSASWRSWRIATACRSGSHHPRAPTANCLPTTLICRPTTPTTTRCWRTRRRSRQQMHGAIRTGPV